MYDFNMCISTDIHFGRDAEKETGRLMAKYADSVLILYGSERIYRDGLGGKLEKYLEKESCSVCRLGGVKPNADSAKIDEAVDMVRRRNINGILAVGGGSVIDTAKAVAVSACSEAPAVEIFRGIAEPGLCLPVGVVLTNAATGSEANPTAVIADQVNGEKLLFSDQRMRPKFAILDPALTLSVPAATTAAGGFDIFSHAFERYFDLTRDSLLLDQMTEGVMRTVANVLPRTIQDPGNYQFRAELMLAATVAHSDMIGPGGDFACHSVSHVMTEVFGIDHGAALAMIIPAWCEVMRDLHPERFDQFFRNVFGADTFGEGMEKLREFVRSIGLSETMGNKQNITPEELADMTVGEGKFAGAGYAALTREQAVKIYGRMLAEDKEQTA